MRESLECECGGLSCYACRLRAEARYPQMICAHGKPSGVGCSECGKSINEHMIRQGWYVKEFLKSGRNINNY